MKNQRKRCKFCTKFANSDGICKSHKVTALINSAKPVKGPMFNGRTAQLSTMGRMALAELHRRDIPHTAIIEVVGSVHPDSKRISSVTAYLGRIIEHKTVNARWSDRIVSGIDFGMVLGIVEEVQRRAVTA